MLVICVVKSAAGASIEHWRSKLLGGSGGMPPQKFLKIRVSKMTISCNLCSFSTCFTSHLFVICRNHGTKIKTFLGIGWFYQKFRAWTQVQVFTQSRRVSGFKNSNAGHTRLARVTWGLWEKLWCCVGGKWKWVFGFNNRVDKVIWPP